nr:MAG TPA: hypothetical protein [Caudoviricetes sp.]
MRISSQTSNKTQPFGNPADFSLLLLDRRGFFYQFLNLRKGLLKSPPIPSFAE